jgi:hypothetical protein
VPDTRNQPHHTRSPTTPPHKGGRHAACTWHVAVAGPDFASVSANEHPHPTLGGGGLQTPFQATVLLRKEVIQPHLPVRLPCYDFVPIASPTFDGSLHKGWATGFGCCRLS